jgi:steroid delta-isomerase-like uncharacterized protein
MRHLNLPFIISGILLGLLLGCNPSEKSQTEINKAVVNQFNEILSSGNFDRMDELFTPDFIRHSQASGDVQIQSLEQYKQYEKMILTAFPDEKNIIHIILAEGDYVAGYNTLIATQKGSFSPFPATGKTGKSDYIWICRLKDGKITEMWVEWDNLAWLTQLGHFPPPKQSEE